MKILICGLNGAGKSTLGRALGRASGWRFADTEDYYFPRPGDYAFSRTKEEAAARPEGLVTKHLATLSLPVLQVDGTKPPEENAAYILKNL